MQFHSLKRKTPNKKSRQVGRGGTRGKTSGRGTKGQNARAGRKKRPELRDFIKRVPKLRGRGKSGLKSIQKKLAGAPLRAHLAEKKAKKAAPAA
jgi:ribosomal protein L15